MQLRNNINISFYIPALMVGQVRVVLVVKAVKKDCRKAVVDYMTAGVGCIMAGYVEWRTSGVAGYTLHVHYAYMCIYMHALQKIDSVCIPHQIYSIMCYMRDCMQRLC